MTQSSNATKATMLHFYFRPFPVLCSHMHYKKVIGNQAADVLHERHYRFVYVQERRERDKKKTHTQTLLISLIKKQKGLILSGFKNISSQN